MLVSFLEVKKKARSTKELAKTSKEALSIGMSIIVINIISWNTIFKNLNLKNNCLFHYTNNFIHHNT